MGDPGLNFLAFVFMLVFVGIVFGFFCLVLLDDDIYQALKKKILSWLK